jgi:hypothetical protein
MDLIDEVNARYAYLKAEKHPEAKIVGTRVEIRSDQVLAAIKVIEKKLNELAEVNYALIRQMADIQNKIYHLEETHKKFMVRG